MSTIAIVGTLISGALVLGIAGALMAMAKKLAPPAHEIFAEPRMKELPAPEEVSEPGELAPPEDK